MKNILLLLLSGVLLVGYGCANVISQLSKIGKGSEITVKKMVPAPVDVSKYKKIAVFDFEGNGGKDIAEWMEIALQNVRTDERPFFEMITRSKMMRLLQEQRLGLTPFIDPDKAAKIGKISGVQAIVTGRMTAYGVQDSNYSKQVTRTRNNQQYRENVPCKGRSAYVDFTVNFLDAQTGQIMASSSADGQMVAEQCQGEADLSQALAKMITDAMFQSIQKRTENVKVVSMDLQPRMLKGAANLAIDLFVKKITPSYQMVPITMLEGDYSGFSGAFKVKPESEKLVKIYYEVGYKYGIRGQWEDAVKQWEKVLEIDPQRPAAIYNIGVAFEMTGDIFLAEKQYKTAVEIKPEDLFFDALARVRKSIEERKKFVPQPGNPPGRKEQPPLTKERPSADPEQKSNPDLKPIPPNEQNGKEKSIPEPKEGLNPPVRIKVASSDVKAVRLNRAKALYTLKRGEEAEKLEEKGDWLKVRVVSNNNEVIGWVLKYDCEGYSKKQKKGKQNVPTKKGAPQKQNGVKKISPM
jgi:tetratricopeptide (TPR) repeat protein